MNTVLRNKLIDIYENYKARLLCFDLVEQPLQFDNFLYKVKDEKIFFYGFVEPLSGDVEIPDIFDVYDCRLQNDDKIIAHSINRLIDKNITVNLEPIYSNLDLNACYLLNANYISTHLFSNSTIKEVYADNVKNLGDSAFEGCKQLCKVSLPLVEFMSKKCFQDCTNLVNIELPSLISFSSYAFAACTHLESVCLSENVAYIPNYAFLCDDNLKSVTNISNVFRIGEEAFRLSGIEELDCRNVSSIERLAFSRSKLKHIVLSRKLESVDYMAFSFLDNLTIDFIGSEEEFRAIKLSAGNGNFRGAKVNFISG